MGARLKKHRMIDLNQIFNIKYLITPNANFRQTYAQHIKTPMKNTKTHIEPSNKSL